MQPSRPAVTTMRPRMVPGRQIRSTDDGVIDRRWRVTDSGNATFFLFDLECAGVCRINPPYSAEMLFHDCNLVIHITTITQGLAAITLRLYRHYPALRRPYSTRFP